MSLVVVDNLSNSSEAPLSASASWSGDLTFHHVDLLDEARLDAVLGDRPVDAVVHVAGLKALDESVEQRLMYYKNNLAGTVGLLKAMRRHGMRGLVFPSSYNVYGILRPFLWRDVRDRPASTYGRTRRTSKPSSQTSPGPRRDGVSWCFATSKQSAPT